MTSVAAVRPVVLPLSRLKLSRTIRTWSVVSLSYLLLTVAYWGWFVFGRGLPSETGMVALSQTRPWLDGFTYPDSSRMWMSASWQVAYLLFGGSYFGLHLVLGIYVFLTGILTYAVVRQFQLGLLGAFIAGAIALANGADQGTNWLGFLGQRQSICALLLAILLVVAACRRSGYASAVVLGLIAGLLLYFALWTYEAVLPLAFGVPLLIAVCARGRKLALWGALWLVLPLINVWMMAQRYFVAGEQSYQTRVLASAGLSLPDMLGNFAQLVTNGLEFWTWPAQFLPDSVGCEPVVAASVVPPVLLASAGFLGSGLVIQRGENSRPRVSALLWALLIGCIFLSLSYAIFVPLTSASWRTQLFSAPPIAIIAAALILLCTRAMGRAGSYVALAAGAVIVASGVSSGGLEQLQLQHDWLGYRQVMSSIVRTAPQLEDNSMVLLVDVPSRQSYSVCPNDPPFDPFRDVLWFDNGLQVLYPGTKLVGVYYRSDGSTSDSIRYQFNASGADMVKAGVSVASEHFSYAQMLAFRYDPATGATLLDQIPFVSIPDSDVRTAPVATEYNPSTRIRPGRIPMEARLRLGF
jgi:hypothetical protein